MSIETIAVLGAGQMGSGIAQIAAASGYKVIIRDIKQEFCDKGVNGIKAGLDKQGCQGQDDSGGCRRHHGPHLHHRRAGGRCPR